MNSQDTECVTGHVSPSRATFAVGALLSTSALHAIFLSTLVMIGQNRRAAFQQARADHDFAAQEPLAKSMCSHRNCNEGPFRHRLGTRTPRRARPCSTRQRTATIRPGYSSPNRDRCRSVTSMHFVCELRDHVSQGRHCQWFDPTAQASARVLDPARPDPAVATGRRPTAASGLSCSAPGRH
jgi:hypothetical protein